jgi:hypothetical protein
MARVIYQEAATAMSVEADFFFSFNNFVAGNTTALFDLFAPLDDAYWDVMVIPSGGGPLTGLQVLNKIAVRNEDGSRILRYNVQNSSVVGTTFSRAAIRIPNQ